MSAEPDAVGEVLTAANARWGRHLRLRYRFPAGAEGVYAVEDGGGSYALRYWRGTADIEALFVTAEQRLDMPQPHRDALLRADRDAAGPPPEDLARMQRVMALIHGAWCAIHLRLLVPECIEKKRFSSPDLDVSTHLQDHIAECHRRRDLVEATVQRLD